MSAKPITRPMTDSNYETGYVCVAPGGCRLSPKITIRSDGVWVRHDPGDLSSSAHRECYEAAVKAGLYGDDGDGWQDVGGGWQARIGNAGRIESRRKPHGSRSQKLHSMAFGDVLSAAGIVGDPDDITEIRIIAKPGHLVTVEVTYLGDDRLLSLAKLTVEPSDSNVGSVLDGFEAGVTAERNGQVVKMRNAIRSQYGLED